MAAAFPASRNPSRTSTIASSVTPSSSDTSSTMWTSRSGSGTGTSRVGDTVQRPGAPAYSVGSARRPRLEDVPVRARVGQHGAREPGRDQQVVVLGLGAFAGAEHHQHVQVDEVDVALVRGG